MFKAGLLRPCRQLSPDRGGTSCDSPFSKKGVEIMKCHSYKYFLVLFVGLVLAFTFCITNPVAAQEEPKYNLLFMREACVKDGKFREAVQFAKEVREYINNKFPDSNLRVYVRIFGEMGKLYWVSEIKDLATLERNNGQLMADPGYLAILQKSFGLFIEGSGHDTLMALIQ